MPMSVNGDIYLEAAGALLRDPPFLVLTGAGISVESGLPPFRGPGGIWTRFDPEEYGHIDTFESDPEKAWVLLWELIRGSLQCDPNEAHLALSRLEKNGISGPIVTQNVDGLHRAAGSVDVIDVHGDARMILCPGCGNGERVDPDSIGTLNNICSCGSYKRPDIVFFGEQLPEEKIERVWDIASSGKDLLVIGTSGVVMPVARIPFIVKASGGVVVEIDPYPADMAGSVTDILIKEKAVNGMIRLERSIMSLRG